MKEPLIWWSATISASGVNDQDVALVVEVIIEHDEEACRLLKHTGIGENA